MPDQKREQQISELKALRSELLAQYNRSQSQTKLFETDNEAEAILLRKSLLEDYSESQENGLHSIQYEDDESGGENKAPIKRMTYEKSR